MTDTTPEIKQKQLEIWLAKTPMERLRRTLEDNDALYALWANLKKNKPEMFHTELRPALTYRANN